MSFSVCALPRLTLIAPRSASAPIAVSTWLAPIFPDEQAAPADTRDTFHVKRDLRRLGLQAGQRKEARVGKTVHRHAMQDHVGRLVAQTGLERVAQGSDPADTGEPLLRGISRSPESRDADKVLGSAAMALFLAATAQERRRHQDFAGTDKRPDPLRPPIL
jgi:hypothetical protein